MSRVQNTKKLTWERSKQIVWLMNQLVPSSIDFEFVVGGEMEGQSGITVRLPFGGWVKCYKMAVPNFEYYFDTSWLEGDTLLPDGTWGESSHLCVFRTTRNGEDDLTPDGKPTLSSDNLTIAKWILAIVCSEYEGNAAVGTPKEQVQ